MGITTQCAAEAPEGLIESILVQATRIGPDAVAELLVKSIKAEFETRGRNGVHPEEINAIRALAAQIQEGVPAIPLPGLVMEEIIAAVQADQPSLETAAPVLLGRVVIERCRSAIADLRDQRRSATTLAATTIGPNRNISLLGVGDRHKDLTMALASQYGRRTRILVCEVDDGYKDDRNPATDNGVHELTSCLRSGDPVTDLPTVEAVHLRDAALAVSQSDFLFVLACGVGLSGELIVPRGAESVYHSALAFGKDVGIIVGLGDILRQHAVPTNASAYTILAPSPNVRVFCSDREHGLSGFIQLASGTDAPSPVATAIDQA